MLLALFSHPKDSIRVTALKCINSLIPLGTQALLLNMDAYLEVIKNVYFRVIFRFVLVGIYPPYSCFGGSDLRRQRDNE